MVKKLTDWRKGCKKILHVNGNQKQVGVAILRSDKADFKSETVKKIQSHYNDKGINSIERYNNPKYICTQHQRTKTQIHKIRPKKRYK